MRFLRPVIVFRAKHARLSLHRLMSTKLERPSPPPLPREEQREFEQLLQKAQTPLSSGANAPDEVDLTMHPDARKPVLPEFEGDVNPITGEQGGPKREPVRRWGGEGDWSHKGRVSDF